MPIFLPTKPEYTESRNQNKPENLGPIVTNLVMHWVLPITPLGKTVTTSWFCERVTDRWFIQNQWSIAEDDS